MKTKNEISIENFKNSNQNLTYLIVVSSYDRFEDNMELLEGSWKEVVNFCEEVFGGFDMLEDNGEDSVRIFIK